MNKPSATETRTYIAAFLTILILTCMMISYLSGMTDEAVLEDHELNQIVNAAIADRDAAQARYDALAHAAGEGAILEAAMNLQREQEQGQ